MPAFEIRPYNRARKDIVVDGPDELRFYVDYDDVDHDTVDAQVEQMVELLNEHWDPRPPDLGWTAPR